VQQYRSKPIGALLAKEATEEGVLLESDDELLESTEEFGLD
jgi:hypothetical protein